MSRKPYPKYPLTDAEYAVVNKVARKLKVDCWFSMVDETDNNGITIATAVYDLERKRKVSLQFGLRQLNDAFEADETRNTELLTKTEVAVYKGLLKKLNITY